MRTMNCKRTCTTKSLIGLELFCIVVRDISFVIFYQFLSLETTKLRNRNIQNTMGTLKKVRITWLQRITNYRISRALNVQRLRIQDETITIQFIVTVRKGKKYLRAWYTVNYRLHNCTCMYTSVYISQYSLKRVSNDTHLLKVWH